MGAGQSSDTAASNVAVKTSYYELIGVSRQATEEEIKKAYRRKALELHPDRNFGNEDSATQTFTEVQAAYDVLSDPQERAWYDSHEAAILRGGDGGPDETAIHTYENVRVTSADDLARVVRRFNSHVEFSDAPSGFYGFLREQFEHLVKEEEAASAWEDVDAPDYPSFGHKDDSHDDVVKSFYSAWMNFSTVKTFAWKDKYRLSEAPDRSTRRLMEKENASLRQEAVREFNDAVRSFVLFARKRDPRYKPSSQSEAERQRVLRDAAAAQAARARAANQAKLPGEIPAWATFREPDEIMESDEEEIVEEVLECVACNKMFKSEKQFEAHERSKKHQKAISALQKKMRKEDADLHLEQTTEEGQDQRSELEDWELADEEQAVDLAQNDLGESVNKSGDEAAEHDAEVKSDLKGDRDSAEAEDTSSETDDSYPDAESLAAAINNTTIEDADAADGKASPPMRKMGKAAQKRAKKAAAEPLASEHDVKQHKCAGCDATFPSRTRLFQHIKDHGHAAPKNVSAAATKGKKGKNKR